MSNELLITVEEAARRLALGRSITYALIRSERLRSVKVGAARRVLVSDLDEFVRTLRETSGGDLR